MSKNYMKQLAEAILRMRAFGFGKKEEGKLVKGEISISGDYRNLPEITKALMAFKACHDDLVYHAIQKGRELALMLVSSEESVWGYERQDIEFGLSFAYVINLDLPEMSGYTYINLGRAADGSLSRTA